MQHFRFIYVAVLVVFTPSIVFSAPTQREISSGWQLRQARLTNWYPATVPGVVHTDLLANKLIDDPFFRLNERGLQWIDKEDWIYRTYFSVSREELAQTNLRLRFYGLDNYADVYLNGEKLLAADNMFREWTVDVKGKVKQDSNLLYIYFHSPIKVDIPKFDALPYQYRTGPDQSENGGIFDKRVSIFARKAGYQYGWDCGPRFVTTGVWRPVTLEAWSNVRIESVHVQQRSVSRSKATLTVSVEALADADVPGAKLVVRDKSAGKTCGVATVNLRQGINLASVDFSIKNPKLWWSNGLGEPNLYTFEVALTAAAAKLDEREVTTGLRSLKVVSEPDEHGEAFYFELNGVKVFAKGANYIPQDNFLPRVTAEQYEKTVMDAVNANMNTLRVWGGGVYECDLFYELCDRHGIMVWQDFMFACSLYPSEGAFLENIRREAIDNVKRLRNHPSIALWCGNNEVYYFWTLWSYDEYYRRQNPEYEKIIWRQYADLFNGVLPDVVASYSPGTFYLSSSPYNKDKDEEHNGDRHYWGVWHGNAPTAEFNTVRSRFFSEYGFQSFPEFESVKRFAPDSADWSITSEVMMAHQRAGSYANPRIAEYLQREYRQPQKFEDFLYMSQVLQGDAIKTAIEAHRRDMPYCMGTLFWQHNDCWPVASWASRDYYGRWKAQHYFAREAYRDVLVSPIVEGQRLSVFVVSDRLTPTEGVLHLKVMKPDGALVGELSRRLTAPANASRRQLSLDLDSLLNGTPRNEALVTVQLVDKTGKVYKNRYFLTLQKDVDFPAVNISRSVRPVVGGFEVNLSSDKFARAVFLSLSGSDYFFEDNYFDILPGQTVCVRVKTSLPEAEFSRQLRITSMNSAQ
ncbi:MAG: glycoside hydrolase family 2 protein [Prevotellaceae bacterium]|jgi:beta-mannosidase|nr:glycoside hydrolase family 2 protein [Prevotellaceae bacterium]